MVVVTGSTGHLGTVLVRALTERGTAVRAVARAGSDCSLLSSGVEVARADVLDTPSLEAAFRGAESVIHAAGHVSFGIGERRLLHSVNVAGTANVIHACRSAGVRRLVYVSSIEALDLSGAGEVTEEAGFHPDRTIMEYGKTKALASLDVLRASREGLDAVVVCPTGYIGPQDHRLSAMGRLVVDYARRRLPATVGGGFDFVDVRDVAEGAIRACELGRSGESYILSGSYLSVDAIMEALADSTGVSPPRLKLPAAFALGVARVAELWSALFSRPPRFTTGSVRILSLGVRVSSLKARRELGYTARQFTETLRDTLEWMAEEGLLQRFAASTGHPPAASAGTSSTEPEAAAPEASEPVAPERKDPKPR